MICKYEKLYPVHNPKYMLKILVFKVDSNIQV